MTMENPIYIYIHIYILCIYIYYILYIYPYIPYIHWSDPHFRWSHPSKKKTRLRSAGRSGHHVRGPGVTTSGTTVETFTCIPYLL